RLALRDDVERVREVLADSDVASNGTRAVAVYACGLVDLLEIVRLRRPIGNKVVLDRTPCVEPLVVQGMDERWLVVLANRRAARLGDLKAKLHPYLRERVAGKVQLDVENASLDDVRTCVLDAIKEHTRRSEREALDRLQESVGRGGRGAAGVAEVLDALNQAR